MVLVGSNKKQLQFIFILEMLVKEQETCFSKLETNGSYKPGNIRLPEKYAEIRVSRTFSSRTLKHLRPNPARFIYLATD